MITPNRSFSKVLEQYALQIASAFIESADQQTQSELIQLICGIDTTSGLVEDHTELLPGEAEKSEWQQVLDAPVNWAAISSHKLISQIRQRVNRNELYMAHLRQAIQTVEQRCQRTQDTIASEPNRSNMLDRHRKTQVCFQRQLDLPQKAQQVNLNRLGRLEQSEVKRKSFC